MFDVTFAENISMRCYRAARNGPYFADSALIEGASICERYVIPPLLHPTVNPIWSTGSWARLALFSAKV